MPDQPPYAFVYVHTDIPPGMTIREWRGRRAAERAAAMQAAREARRPAIGSPTSVVGRSHMVGGARSRAARLRAPSTRMTCRSLTGAAVAAIGHAGRRGLVSR